MGLSDSRRGRLTVMDSRQTLRPGPSPRRVSQVPRCDCLNAPSPCTPGCSAAAFARCFTADGRLYHIRLAGRTQKHNEAEPGSLALGLIRSQSGRLTSFAPTHDYGDRPASRVRLPCHGGPLLRDERAIITADSFQSASRTRLRLALLSLQKSEGFRDKASRVKPPR